MARLIQANSLLLEPFSIVGIDLVSMFDPHSKAPNLQLLEADLSNWAPLEKFDLITCVHGLHYIGDKLNLISRAVSWLTPDGVFKANLDLKSLRRGIESSKQIPVRVLERKGLTYNRATHVLSCEGHRDAEFSQFDYLGADDQAGPNYTRQPAVNSHYKHIGEKRNRSKAAKKRRAEKRAKHDQTN
jgi:SAM-dependent methyltransferase